MAQEDSKLPEQQKFENITVSWPKNWTYQAHASGFAITAISKGKEKKVLANVVLQVVDNAKDDRQIAGIVGNFSRKFYLEELTGLDYEIIAEEEAVGDFSGQQWQGKKTIVLERIFDNTTVEEVYGQVIGNKQILIVANYLQKERKLKKSVNCILQSIKLN